MRRASGWLVLASILACGAGSRVEAGDRLAAYVKPGFCAAIIFHPDRIAQSPLAASLPTKPEMASGKVPGGDLVAKFDAKALKRVVVLLEPAVGQQPPVAGVALVQFVEPIDGAAAIKAGWSDAQEATAGEVKYFKSESQGTNGVALAAAAVGQQTLAIGPEPALTRMLAAGERPSALLQLLKTADLKHDVIVLFSADALKSKLAADGMPVEKVLAEQAGPFAPIAGDAKSVQLTIDLSGKQLARLTLAMGQPQMAAALQAQAAPMVMVASAQLPALKQQTGAMLPPASADTIFKVLQEALAGTKVSQKGNDVIVEMATPASLGELPKALAELAPIIQTLPGAAGAGK